jgi:hypothetical protein
VHKALRHSHPSLFVPALASLASLLEAMDSAAHLARAVATWLPPVLERLGDAMERVRVAARGALDAVVAAAMGKMGAAGVQRGENAAASLERLLREVGLQGKSPRVREQVRSCALAALSRVRRERERRLMPCPSSGHAASP